MRSGAITLGEYNFLLSDPLMDLSLLSPHFAGLLLLLPSLLLLLVLISQELELILMSPQDSLNIGVHLRHDVLY